MFLTYPLFAFTWKARGALFLVDFLIDLDGQNKDALAKMKEPESEGELVCTTVINAAEYDPGASRSKGKNAVERTKAPK